MNKNFSFKTIFSRIATWLNTSNRKKHLIGGFAVGLLGWTPWTAIYATIVAASCLELKDHLYGYRWDWTDWLLTVAGGAVAAITWLLL